MPDPKIPRLIWITLAILVAISLMSLLIAIRKPGGHSYPQIVAQPVTPIDYQKIEDYLSKQIASIPKAEPAANGINGENGSNGTNGMTGAVGLTGITGTMGETGATGPQGPQGDPGAPAQPIELRYNTALSEIQWRYVGDIGWRVLVTSCTLTNSCAGS